MKARKLLVAAISIGLVILATGSSALGLLPLARPNW